MKRLRKLLEENLKSMVLRVPWPSVDVIMPHYDVLTSEGYIDVMGKISA